MLHGPSDLVKTLLIDATVKNTILNKDGTGLFIVNDEKMFKDKDEGAIVVDKEEYKSFVRENLVHDPTTTISHVRAASKDFKEICDENCHPFEIDNLVLAHNGTLEPKDDKLKVKDKIDSYWFLARLAREVNGEKLTPKHISDAMNDFYGKFALLIYDKLQPNKVFVVRGRTASLYYSYFSETEDENNNVGFMINTTEDQIEQFVSLLLLEMFTGKSYVYGEPESLDRESIYIFDRKTGVLEKTEQDIKEKSPPKTTTKSRRWNSRYNGRYSNWGEKKNITNSFVEEILDAAKVKDLTIEELNMIFYMLYGISIFECTGPSLSTISEILNTDVTGRGKVKLWSKIKTKYFQKNPDKVFMDIYNDLSIKFPWFDTKMEELKNVFDSL